MNTIGNTIAVPAPVPVPLPLPRLRRGRRPLPGFGLSLGLGLAWMSLIVLLPLAALVWQAAGLGADGWLRTIHDPRVQASLKLSFSVAFIAALIASVAGALVAWVVVRYRFPGRRLIDALVDLPFALPTAVAGIALTAIYSPNGWVGQWLEPFGVKIAYAQTGIVIALVFIGLPFAMRTLQPVLESLHREHEEAAASLGASRGTTLRRVILPQAARTAVPPLSNTLISLVKDTSLASTILVTELLRVAQLAAAPTFDFFALYGVAALYYWAICVILSFFQGRLETRLGRYVLR